MLEIKLFFPTCSISHVKHAAESGGGGSVCALVTKLLIAALVCRYSRLSAEDVAEKGYVFVIFERTGM